MDSMFNQLFALPNLIFCLMVTILVWIQRKVIATAWKGAETNKLYREILLPLGPIGTGAILAACVKSYPYPESFHSFGPRVIYGSVIGLVSAHGYKMLKAYFAKAGDNSAKQDDSL
jgi:hypothetical protein